MMKGPSLMQKKLVEENLPEDTWEEIMVPPVDTKKSRKLLGSGCDKRCREMETKTGQSEAQLKGMQEQANKETAQKAGITKEYQAKRTAAEAEERVDEAKETEATNKEKSAKQVMQDSQKEECTSKRGIEVTYKQASEAISKERTAKLALANFYKYAATGCYDENSEACISFKKNGLCNPPGNAAAQACRRSCGVCSTSNSTNSTSQTSGGY